MRRFISFAVCALLLAVAAACIPESKYPIAPLAEAQQDVALHGLWVREEGTEVQYLHIGAEAEHPADPRAEKPEPGLMRFCFIGHTKDGQQERLGTPVSARFFISKLADECYLNTLMPLDDARPEGAAAPQAYWFMKCRRSGDELRVWLIDFAAAGAAVESGALAGTISRDGKELKSVSITASSERLCAYLTSDAGKKRFVEDNALIFRKLR